ncbi:hypothetical protein N7493_008737, partial [Penicillium malachiteum]
SELKVFAYAKFSLQALCRRASTLRQGIPCTCDPNQRPASGGFNWVIFVSFEDGIRWVLRYPHTREFMPIQLGLKLLQSEAATIRYLKAHSDIKSMTIGNPLPSHDMHILTSHSTSADNEIGIPGSEAIDRAKILSQLDNIAWKLSKLPFDRIESIFEEDGPFVIKECLSRGHILHRRCFLEIPRGPFASEADFYDSLASAFSEHVEIMPLSHHCFVAPVPSRDDYQDRKQYERAVDLWSDFVTIGNKIETADNRLDYLIAGDFMRDIIRKHDLSADHRGSFPLCHPDLSVNNIFVDDSSNIACIIDWAFKSSTSESFLFAAPGLPQYGDKLSSDLHGSFKSSFLDSRPKTMEEMLIKKYRESLDRGQEFWTLSRLLNLDSISDYSLFETCWSSAFGPRGLGQYFLEQRRSTRYIQRYKEVQKEDPAPAKVKQDEISYFQNNDLGNAIARKLTIMSEWNTQHTTDGSRRVRQDMFVADSRLWKWIQNCMQDWEDST